MSNSSSPVCPSLLCPKTRKLSYWTQAWLTWEIEEGNRVSKKLSTLWLAWKRKETGSEAHIASTDRKKQAQWYKIKTWILKCFLQVSCAFLFLSVAGKLWQGRVHTGIVAHDTLACVQHYPRHYLHAVMNCVCMPSIYVIHAFCCVHINQLPCWGCSG